MESKKDAYHRYLLSDEWRAKSEQRKQLDGHKCAICGCRNHLNVHHWTYDNVYNEDPQADLITLCEDCHINILHPLKKTCMEYVVQQQDAARREINRCVSEISDGYRENVTEKVAESFAELFKANTISGNGNYYRIVRGVQSMFDGCKIKSRANAVNYDWIFAYSCSNLGSRIAEKRKAKGYTRNKDKQVGGHNK